jgi:hypothetical protein
VHHLFFDSAMIPTSKVRPRNFSKRGPAVGRFQDACFTIFFFLPRCLVHCALFSFGQWGNKDRCRGTARENSVTASQSQQLQYKPQASSQKVQEVAYVLFLICPGEGQWVRRVFVGRKEGEARLKAMACAGAYA